MRFKATQGLLWLLHTQIAEFPGDAIKKPWAGCTVYDKLAALQKGGVIEIDEAERKELASLLDSIVGEGGWDTIYPNEKRVGRAALKQLTVAP